MATKHLKINPIKCYKPRNKYQKYREWRKNINILIKTTIFVVVFGVFLKGILAEDGSIQDDLGPNVNQSNDVPTANETDDTNDEATTDNVTSPVDLKDNDDREERGNNNNNGREAGRKSNNFRCRPDRVGHGSQHEQAGSPHFKPIDRTPYVPTVNFSNRVPKLAYGMGPIFKLSNSILNVMGPEDTFPDGYVEIRDDKNFYLGRRVHNNDWLPLLGRYWLAWLIVAFFLFNIIVLPFIAVCYCCFCCHKRCGRYCPPCAEQSDKNRRCCYGILLFILIIGLSFGVTVAFTTNRLLESGFAQSAKNIERSSEDTCRFLTNTNNHLKHLYMNNYEELTTQLTQQMENSHLHITEDLADIAKEDEIRELKRILSNMPSALRDMIELDKHEKEARFLASQLRDALRGAKRDLNYMRVLCDGILCEDFSKDYKIYGMDCGCLHYDNVPNTTIYIEAIKEIIMLDLVQIPLRGLEKIKRIDDAVLKFHKHIIPLFVGSLLGGSETMSDQAETISLLVDKVISDIYLKTMRTSHSFDDIYSKLGAYRNLANVILCIVLLAILICLIIGLLFGCFAELRHAYRDNCCNKDTGATFLLIAMLLIFLSFSIIALIGIFYLIFGFLAYHGACAPLRDTTKNDIFNSFDSLIDFHKVAPPMRLGNIGEDSTENPLPPLRFSTALKACRSNESIIDVLQLNEFYSVRNLELLKIYKNISHHAASLPSVQNSLRSFQFISDDDMVKLEKMRETNLATYHSSVYENEMCYPAPKLVALPKVMAAIANLMTQLENAQWVGYTNTKQQLDAYQNDIQKQLHNTLEHIYSLVKSLDSKITYKKLNFNESISTILQDIRDLQKCIRLFGDGMVVTLTANLTQFVVRQFGDYKDYVVYETQFNVGRCEPLAYIYENGVDIVCGRMVDPMNGFWMGVLLSCFLLLPTLWVAHKLQCLYKRVGYYAPPAATGCPECTGAPGPIKPATVMVCSDGLCNKQRQRPSLKRQVQKYDNCPCPSQTIDDHRASRNKRDKNNDNSGTISERGDFFDVEAQQIFVFHELSHAFPKRKID